MQCREILSLIDTSRAGRTTLEVHLRLCELLFGMQVGRGISHMGVNHNNNNKSGLVGSCCGSCQCCRARPLGALTGLESSWGRFVQGPHGDSEGMETPRQNRRGPRAGLGLPAVEWAEARPSDFE